MPKHPSKSGYKFIYRYSRIGEARDERDSLIAEGNYARIWITSGGMYEVWSKPNYIGHICPPAGE